MGRCSAPPDWLREDLLRMSGDPIHERQQPLGELATAVRQAVVDPRRDGRAGVAVHEPVRLEHT